MNPLVQIKVHLSLSHSPGLLLSDAWTHRYPELFLSLGSLWPRWEIEHKDGELAITGGREHLGTSSVDKTRGLGFMGREVVREGFPEEMGKGPQRWKE